MANELISKVLTTEDEKELSKGIKNIILKQLETDFKDYDMYLFHPNIIEKKINNMLDDVIEEFEIKLKQELNDHFDGMVERVLNKIL